MSMQMGSLPIRMVHVVQHAHLMRSSAIRMPPCKLPGRVGASYGLCMCREFFKGLYSRLESSLFSQHRQQFGPDAFSFPKFLWAVQTMRSRVHAPLDGRNIALVPFADLVQVPPIKLPEIVA